MKPNTNRFFDDLAKVATGAVGALSGLQGQIRTEIRSQISRFIAEMDFVPREDFEIVEGMAREARLQNQKLETRLVALEAKLGIAKKASAQKTTAKKPTKKKVK